MSRAISLFNFTGIGVLAVVCGLQWNVNRRVNEKAIELERTRLANQARIEEQDQTIKGNLADLDELRQRLTLSETALKESQASLDSMTAERDRLLAERDALATALEKWKTAVAERDAAIKEASTKIETLISERNELVVKFNDLAKKFNADQAK